MNASHARDKSIGSNSRGESVVDPILGPRLLKALLLHLTESSGPPLLSGTT
jgi:hypothetical protein